MHSSEKSKGLPDYNHLKNWVHKNLYKTRGYMHFSDAVSFSKILEFQDQNDITGSIIEIGVFYGRSLSLLEAGRGRDTIVGIDLFDIPGQMSAVERVLQPSNAYRSFLLQRDSQTLRASEIVRQYGTTRFFSVDGGHERHHVKNDFNLAIDCISDNGVIALDDFMNAQYPDLSAMVIEILQERSSEVAPFLITKNKLYVARPEYCKIYKTAFKSFCGWGGCFTEDLRFISTDVVFLRQSMVDRVISEGASAVGLGHWTGLLTGQFRSKASRGDDAGVQNLP